MVNVILAITALMTIIVMFNLFEDLNDLTNASNIKITGLDTEMGKLRTEIEALD